LILRKIIKIVATRCHILRLKCTESFVGWGFTSDPAWGPYKLQHSPYPIIGFWGLTTKGGKGIKSRGEERREW